MCLTHLWRKVKEKLLIELLEFKSLNEHSLGEFLKRKKYHFHLRQLDLIKYLTQPGNIGS